MSWCLLALGLVLSPRDDFARAIEPRVFEFPRDHGAHPEYKTEWWYFTGNVATEAGRRFGYQLTFFRSALTPDAGERTSRWAVRDLYLGHVAVTDVTGERFLHDERLSRESLGMAGAREDDLDVWIRDWRARRTEEGTLILRADTERFGLELELRSAKAPVLHGATPGLSLKGPEPGQASYYVTLTRCETRGRLQIGEESFAVSGLSWMDQEFGSSQLAEGQVGWDWFSLQLDDGSELMLYRMRRRDGSFDTTSSGTAIARDGSTQHLTHSEYSIEATRTWTSPHSGGTYPAAWKIRVPSLDLDLDIVPLRADQELSTRGTTGVTYWEGAGRAAGRRGDKPVSGYGYVELVGYAGAFLRDI